MTVSQWKAQCTAALIAEGLVGSPSLDARLLIEMVTGLDQAKQLMSHDRTLSDEEIAVLGQLQRRRLEHQPMAYIRGKKEFYGRQFTVDERVLIPRSDTEILVETVLSYAKERDRADFLPIIDVCTGSGAVGITLALELEVTVTLSDLSAPALEVAAKNARTLGERPFTLVEDDLLLNSETKYGIIVSNPPYLSPSWIDEVAREVGWEPRMALDGHSDDGLAVIRRLVDQSRNSLKEGGALFLECDHRQTEEVSSLLRLASFTDIQVVRDLGGHERVVWGRLHE